MKPFTSHLSQSPANRRPSSFSACCIGPSSAATYVTSGPSRSKAGEDNVSSRWLSRTEGQVSPEEAMALGLAPGSTVLRIARLHLTEARPLSLEYATIPLAHLSSPLAVGAPLLGVSPHFRPKRILQRLRAVRLEAEQLRLLDIQGPAAGLEIERRAFAANGRPVELARCYYPGDAYEHMCELGATA